jgi:hypothetical protein
MALCLCKDLTHTLHSCNTISTGKSMRDHGFTYDGHGRRCRLCVPLHVVLEAKRDLQGGCNVQRQRRPAWGDQ